MWSSHPGLHTGEHRKRLARDASLRAIEKRNTDPKAVMMDTMAKSPRVGSNGGTAAGLVGRYDTVAHRDFHAVGIELFILQFHPFEQEMARFARQITAGVAPRALDRMTRQAGTAQWGLHHHVRGGTDSAIATQRGAARPPPISLAA